MTCEDIGLTAGLKRGVRGVRRGYGYEGGNANGSDLNV
jgi:hypothetical protein